MLFSKVDITFFSLSPKLQFATVCDYSHLGESTWIFFSASFEDGSDYTQKKKNRCI